MLTRTRDHTLIASDVRNYVLSQSFSCTLLGLVDTVHCGDLVCHSQDVPHFGADKKDRFARISLALTIARIFPPGHRARQWAIAMAILFGMMCIAVVVHLSVICERDTSWATSPAEDMQCDVGRVLTITSLICMGILFLREEPNC